jgi:hypothetical protein
MNATLTVRDETTFGFNADGYDFTISLPAEVVTARELIRERVRQEVEGYNARQPEYFRGLVQPTDAERTLNGFRLRKLRALDWREQYDRAVEAFHRNGFILLVDDRQVEDIDALIEVKPRTTVTFLKLIPLVGG